MYIVTQRHIVAYPTEGIYSFILALFPHFTFKESQAYRSLVQTAYISPPSFMAASRRTSPAPAATQRRVVPIKRVDGEPLTRVDIQYDFLQAVFDNTQEVFSDPYAAGTEGKKLSFRELYIKAILNSPKATKALKDKLNESPTFTLDFAMLALLVNVGRVNTTMSCKWSICALSLVPIINAFHSLS